MDEAEEIPGVDYTEETPGVDDEIPENGAEPDEIEDKSAERTFGGMDLRRHSHIYYNCMNHIDKVFHITAETQDDGITLLQFNSDNCEIKEDEFDETDAEYMFLTTTLGWKER